MDNVESKNPHKNVWKCKQCNHRFVPEKQNFRCTRCGSNATVPLNKFPDIIKEEIKPYEKVCQFQIESEKTRKREEYFKCGLTGFASSQSFAGMDYRTNFHYDECNPDICPMYQTWKLIDTHE